MNHYDDMHPNRDNQNVVNEGITDRNISTPGYTYQLNSLSPEYLPHGYELSLACQSGTDMAHTIGNVTAIMLQFVLDLFPSRTFATALPSTKIAHRQLRHTPKQIRTQRCVSSILGSRCLVWIIGWLRDHMQHHFGLLLPIDFRIAPKWKSYSLTNGRELSGEERSTVLLCILISFSSTL